MFGSQLENARQITDEEALLAWSTNAEIRAVVSNFIDYTRHAFPPPIEDEYAIMVVFTKVIMTYQLHLRLENESLKQQVYKLLMSSIRPFIFEKPL